MALSVVQFTASMRSYSSRVMAPPHRPRDRANRLSRPRQAARAVIHPSAVPILIAPACPRPASGPGPADRCHRGPTGFHRRSWLRPFLRRPRKQKVAQTESAAAASLRPAAALPPGMFGTLLEPAGVLTLAAAAVAAVAIGLGVALA